MDIRLDDLPTDMQIAMLIISGAGLLVWFLYANTIRRTMNCIAPENRFFRPAQSWLLLVPFLNIYWNFVVARGMSDSLTNEFFDRKIAEEERPGLATGLVYAWCFLLAHIPLPPFLLMVFMLLSLLYFVHYWVKTNNFRLLLIEHNRYLERQKKDHETA